MNNYDINSIETLEFRDAVRKRIAMYLGSADMQGVYNAIQEIISNSIDEFYMGYGDKIEIFIENNLIKIRDYGRGIPFGTKEDGSNVLVDIFSKPHTGGKFNEKVYQSVAGLNGIGGKAVCLSSDFFTVITKDKKGNVARAYFEKGVLKEYKEKKGVLDCSTEIYFSLDEEVYNLEPIKINAEVLKNKCKNLAYLTKGLSFYIYEGTEAGFVSYKYSAENGLKDLLLDNVKNPINEIPIYFETEENGNKIEIALQWTKEKEKSWVFTNGLENSEGGTSLTGMKTAITRYIKKKLGDNFDGEMARTGLHYAVSCKIPDPSFANQTKTKINNPELNGLAQRVVRKTLEEFERNSPSETKKILDFLAKEQKAEVAANKAREAVLNATKELNENKKKKVFNVDKLSDCEELGENAILLLVEGDSAGGAMARARDTKKFGILRLRGKIVNALSNPLEDVLENEEVKLFLLAVGIDINNYQNSKLRYGKVAICVDADDK